MFIFQKNIHLISEPQAGTPFRAEQYIDVHNHKWVVGCIEERN